MLAFAVCDDEQVAARSVAGLLKRELARRSVEAELQIFTRSRELAALLEQGTHFDALFADIDMPELDGIRLGTLYRAELQDCLLVFISNREDLVFDTFQAKPFRFVRKKDYKAKLPEVLSDVLSELDRAEARKIAFPTGASSTVLLRPERICYVEAVKKKQMVHYGPQAIEVASSFQKVAQQLAPYGFVQSHKSFLVNCRYIRSIAKTDLTLDDGTVIPVSRNYLHGVQDAFVRYAVDLRGG